MICISDVPDNSPCSFRSGSIRRAVSTSLHPYAANMRAWCGANAADPDAHVFRERIETWSRAYERWGRGTMGYALVLLRREVG